jgi:hypothetical protein
VQVFAPHTIHIVQRLQPVADQLAREGCDRMSILLKMTSIFQAPAAEPQPWIAPMQGVMLELYH